MEIDNLIKLKYINPLNNKLDTILITKSDLDAQKESGKKSSISIISFFHKWEDSNYVINLHIDNDYRVRSVHISSFFLRVRDKLYR